MPSAAAAGAAWPPGLARQRAEWGAAFHEFVPHHAHSVGQILLFLRLTLECVLGFRGASAALELLAPLFPSDEPAVSANGGQAWLLRLGRYELTRPKERADDWMWIVDHTIQVGQAKCFVVVGVRPGKPSAWPLIPAAR